MSVPSLEKCAKKYPIAGVLTNPDRVCGRGKRIQETPVKSKAKELGLPLIEAPELDTSVRETIAEKKPDMLVVVAYGKIFDKAFLDLFPKGAINLHPSLLPKYRGPSPLPAAILNGDKETGITVQRLALKMDSGDILAQKKLPLSGTETTGRMTEIVAEEGATMIVSVLESIQSGTEQPIKQNEDDATYCSLIRKEDAVISWDEPAEIIERRVRAFDPWPIAHTFWKGRRLNILSAFPYKRDQSAQNGPGSDEPGTVLGIDKSAGILIQTKDGILAVTRLQLQSKKQMDWKDFINGTQGFIGSVLGER